MLTVRLFVVPPAVPPAMANCPALISGIESPVKAAPIDADRSRTERMTTLLLSLIPFASNSMKSGIYSSAWESGPSSGTEKPRVLSTALARLLAACFTLQASLLMPAAIWMQISLPHW